MFFLPKNCWVMTIKCSLILPYNDVTILQGTSINFLVGGWWLGGGWVLKPTLLEYPLHFTCLNNNIHSLHSLIFQFVLKTIFFLLISYLNIHPQLFIPSMIQVIYCCCCFNCFGFVVVVDPEI